MSSFVVPGANPSANLAVTFGNNSLISMTLTTVPSEVASSDFALLHSSSVKIDACFTVTSQGSYDVAYYLTLDDNKLNDTNFIMSVQGGGKYSTLSISGYCDFVENVGSHTVKLWALTNAPLGMVGLVAVSLSGVANLN